MKVEKFNLLKLDQKVVDEIARLTYSRVFRKFWSGYSFDQYFNEFFSPSENTKKLEINLFKGEAGIVGYLFFRIEELEYEGAIYHVCRFPVNLLPVYAGTDFVYKKIAKLTFKHYLQNLNKNLVLFFTANSPITYCMAKRKARDVYPCPFKPTPKKYLKLIQKIQLVYDGFLTDFSAKPVRGMSDAKPEYQDIYYLYYKFLCPNFEQGQALATIIPVTLGQFLATALKTIKLRD